jgi:sialic acid synthase SpsE
MAITDIQVTPERAIGMSHPPFIIAEVGNNHNGDMDLAIQLVKAAAGANATAVKLQTKNPERAFRKELLDMPYEHENSFGKTYREHKYAVELSEEQTAELYELAHSLGLIAFSTPFDVDSVDMLERIGQPIYKISSFHVTDIELIEKVASTGKPLIMSTGMSSWDEIDKGVEVIRRFTEDFVLMQCTSSYPADLENLNLSAIPAIQERYQCQVGYSGHERGVGIGPGAVLLGARVIERHFTMDRTLKGPDHAASLEPRGLDLLVKRSRNYWKAVGVPEKIIQEPELANRLKFRGY